MPETIRVVFVDEVEGTVLGEVDLPPERLPESFEVETTMHLGDDAWSVVRAEPATAAEFIRTGRLRVEMRRIEMMDPNKILYSLPTISDELPPCAGPGRAPPGAVELHEDDWRQIELVAEACAAETAECLGRIEAICRDHRKGPGFEEIHVRSEVPEPLRGVSLSSRALLAAFEGATDCLSPFIVHHSRVLGGFAIRLASGLALYGSPGDGGVRAIGLARPEAVGEARRDAEALASLMAKHRLQLVDWCHRLVVPADPAAVHAYLVASASAV